MIDQPVYYEIPAEPAPVRLRCGKSHFGTISDLKEKLEDSRAALLEIYNLCSFDYNSMPEHMRFEIFKAVLELADKRLKNVN